MTINEPADRPACLLIVDECSESGEVLRTVFERRGVTIHDACEADLGLELIERCRPDVVVLDADLQGDDADAISRAYHEASSSTDADLVILGKLRKDVGLPSERVIAKPYHFAPLVRTIEALLAKHTRTLKAVELRAA